MDEAAAAQVTEVGGWGPWIVGGGWLTIGGQKGDLLYRPIESVERVICDCREGRVSMDYQPGHPHGFCSAIWMGEVALCRPLSDPEGALARLKAITTPYPEALRETLIRRFQWEILFSIENARTALPKGDETYIAGCAFRSLACAAQVLFAVNRRYVINEKGAHAGAARLPLTVANLTERVKSVWQAIGLCAFDVALTELGSIEHEVAGLVEAARLNRARKMRRRAISYIRRFMTIGAIRILGVDPGLRKTGWGVIEAAGSRLIFIACGSIETDAATSLAERLAAIHRLLTGLVEREGPHEAAVEETFINRDPQSALKLGQARGVALATLALTGLPVAEYAANLIKKTVVGVGHAEKRQVAMMVRMLLPASTASTSDAADALAVAICHAQHRAARARGAA